MRRAFTLIELLVVMAIMAILTIITVSQFNTAKVKARDAQRKADLSSIKNALLMYYADYQRFPEGGTDAGELDLSDSGEFSDAGGYVYMKVMPLEPVEDRRTTNPYCYLRLDGNDLGLDGDSAFAILGRLENVNDGDGFRKDNNEVARNITCGGNTDYNFGFTSPNISMDEVDTTY